MSSDHFIDLEDQPSYQDVPEFTDLDEQISDSLLQINNTLSNLEKNIDVLSDKVQNGSNDFTKNQKTCVNLIGQLVNQFKEISVYDKKINDLPSSVLNKSQVFVRGKLNSELHRSLSKFDELQRQFTKIDRELNAERPKNADNGAVQPDQQADASSFSQQKAQLVMEYQPVDAEEVEYQRGMAEERERDIERIGQGVTELNEIFKDLSGMVSSQGEMIDNIESNIYNTARSTQNASKQLRSADRYHRNRRKFCFWILVILCIVLTFVILIIFA